MSNPLPDHAEQYIRANHRRRRWHRTVTLLASIVVFCTTYALILPAITLEHSCGLEEHTHTDACYTQVNSVTRQVSRCTAVEPVGHRHDALCRDADGALWCPLPEREGHAHSDVCFDETGTRICPRLELTTHQHTDACLETVTEPVNPNALTCACTDADHVHGSRCFGIWELTCGQEAHTHTIGCAPKETLSELLCGLGEHTHSQLCLDGTGEAACGMVEHVHSESCLPAGDEVLPAEDAISPEDQARLDAVSALIAALPDSADLAEALETLEAAGDPAALEEYYHSALLQARSAYAQYQELSPDLQAQLANRDKLLELEWLWDAETLEITDTLTVYQVNQYSQVATTLVYGGSVSEKLGNGMSFAYWDAIVVEKNASGTLYVSRYVTADGDKSAYKANTSDGFVLLLYNTTVNANVGDLVTVDFDYKGTTGYNSSGYGTVTFGGEAKPPKPDKTNTPDTADSADTRDLIEVNLYDYGSNINDKWNSDKKYPGFQQDGGSTNVGSSFSSWASFNFGNNITKDLAAGNSKVTVQDGSNINATVKDNNDAYANLPASGAMLNKLQDGYPALADGTSLSYLFSNSDYAKKQNSQSINGLFQHNPTTGAYTFNSRTNHAQFNPADDTFTLYQQIISSNFMMYPFGNFLPFNDIVHQSAQASTINKEYLQTIAASALYKYNNGAGDAYKTLSEQLTKFIGLMDNAYPASKYPDGWTAADCANEYFKAASIPKSFTTDELSNIYSIDFDEPTDFYFGMEMKMNFFQPKGGLTGTDGKQPMIFYFTGDDDVWVYVDGVLFLDLSGIHRHVGGEIDFVNGEVKYYALDVATGDVSETPYKTLPFSELVDPSQLNGKGTFEDYSQHTFNFYYMERGAGSGVCRMNFNFPLLHKNAISVTKELSVDDPSKLPLLGDPDFKFQVLKENGTELFIPAGTEYDILDANGNSTGKGQVGTNGIFTLKAGQTAVFKDIKEDAGKYFVRELLDESVFEQYGMVSVNGSTQTTNYDVTVGAETFKGLNSPVQDMSNGSTVFRFNNHVDTNKLGSLSITKTLTGYSPARASPQFTFAVTLDDQPLPVGTKFTVGEGTREVKTVGEITLAPGETAVISNILAGTKFTVAETKASAEGYTVTYTVNDGEPSETSASGTIKLASAVAVHINNTETGTSVDLPVQKTLEFSDGQEHTYTFQLTQVKSQTDLAEIDGTTKELEITVSKAPVTQNFTIGYPFNVLDGKPSETFYYKITEQPDDDGITIYDNSVYVVEVTVSETDGALSAAVTAVWKDGEAQAPADAVLAFTNQLVRYELPETGGMGTYGYTMGGLLLLALAGLLYQTRRIKERKGGTE